MTAQAGSEPEYVVVQPGLDGVAWLGEVTDGGELSPIGKIADLLAAGSEDAGLMLSAEERALVTYHAVEGPMYHEGVVGRIVAARVKAALAEQSVAYMRVFVAMWTARNVSPPGDTFTRERVTPQ